MPPKGWRKAKKMPMPDSPPPVPPPEDDVSVVLKRDKGKTTLLVKNKGLIKYLQEIGAMTAAGKLVAGTISDTAVDTYAGVLMPGALCKYTPEGEYSLDVTRLYGEPVSRKVLEGLAKSVPATLEKLFGILQPIEVHASVTLKRS